MASGFRHYRWIICALLFFATTINYIDRSILSLLKETLDREIGWTNQQFGWVNSAFFLAYSAGLIFFGWFVDRFGTKVGYAVSIAAWSLAAMGHSLVGTFRGFIFARIGLGFSEGGNFPSAIKAPAIIPWVGSTDSAWGWKAFCIRHGWDQTLPWLGHTWGWRAAFVAAGLLGFLWLFFWGPFYNVPEKIRRLSAAEL